MLLLPVRISTLGVRWHREQRAASNEYLESYEDEQDVESEEELEDADVDADEAESSLVTCRTFWTGKGRGRLGEPWAAAVCIWRKEVVEFAGGDAIAACGREARRGLMGWLTGEGGVARGLLNSVDVGDGAGDSWSGLLLLLFCWQQDDLMVK